MLSEDQVEYIAIIKSLKMLKTIRYNIRECRQQPVEQGDFRPMHVDELEITIINSISIINQGVGEINIQRMAKEGKPPIKLSTKVLFTNLKKKQIPLMGFPMTIDDERTNDHRNKTLPDERLSDQHGMIRIDISNNSPLYQDYINENQPIFLVIKPHDEIRKLISREAEDRLFNKRFQVQVRILPDSEGHLKR